MNQTALQGRHAGKGLPDVASLWQATAAPLPSLPRLQGDIAVDVAIIGGGYTGLNAARALVRRGLSVAVLEANRIGWGASGRNGGVVEGKFRLSFRDIAKAHGTDAARRMYDIGTRAVEHVEELVSEYGLTAADYRRTGNMRCAHNAGKWQALRDEDAWSREVLGAGKTRLLGPEEMAAETGSPDFVGGVLQQHGGSIHPLNYVRGLARAIAAEGVGLHEESAVQHIRREANGIRLILDAGSVTAAQVLIATNGYSDLTGFSDRARRSVIPFRSAIIATAPLDTARVLPGLVAGRSYSEMRRMMRWFRLAGDRLLFGGRGAFGREDTPQAFDALEAAMHRQFPALEGARIDYRWSGLVALTLQAVPQLVRQDDRVVYALGYNGLGVATASYLGMQAAGLLCGDATDLALLTPGRLRQVPLYRLRSPAVRAAAAWYQVLDRIGR